MGASTRRLLRPEIAEHRQVNVVARRLQTLREARPDASRHELAHDPARTVPSLAHEAEELLEHDAVALHAGHLAHARDLPRPVRHASRVDDDVEREADLLAHGTRG